MALTLERAKPIVMWEDPKLTGGVLGGSTVAYAILTYSGYTMLSLICNVLLVTIVGCFIWSHLSTLMGRNGPPIPKFEISEATARTCADKGALYFNKASAFLFVVLTGSDFLLSIKCALALWVAGKVGGLFNFFTMVYLIVLLSLTVPKIYVAKQQEIDRLLAVGLEYSKNYYAVIEKAITDKFPKSAEAKKET